MQINKLTITGARRSGKTTALVRMLKQEVQRKNRKILVVTSTHGEQDIIREQMSKFGFKKIAKMTKYATYYNNESEIHYVIAGPNSTPARGQYVHTVLIDNAEFIDKTFYTHVLSTLGVTRVIETRTDNEERGVLG